MADFSNPGSISDLACIMKKNNHTGVAGCPRQRPFRWMIIYRLLLMATLMVFTLQSFAQRDKTKLYFLVDTINIPKSQRFIEISNEYEVGYTFYCKCLPSVYEGQPHDDLIYTFINSKQAQQNVTAKKPDVNYISWKELLNLAVRPGFFKDNYELYITEVMPDHKFRTNKVELRRISRTDAKEKLVNEP